MTIGPIQGTSVHVGDRDHRRLRLYRGALRGSASRGRRHARTARLGVGQRSRAALAPEFADGYEREVLDQADLERIVLELPERGLAALLCVERDPEACHRSLIAERLAADHGLRVRHLRP